MAKRVLVAYVSKCGSTAEVAEAVAAELRKAGVIADVAPVGRARPASYEAVVLGTCVRMGKPPGDAVKFAGKVRDLPVAVFSLGLQ